MITPEEFPYIKNVHVNRCYTYSNFGIELKNYQPFSHLILTGKNGSGKSTILNSINQYLLVALGIGSDHITDPVKMANTLFYINKGNYMEASKMGGNWDEYNANSKTMNELNKVQLYEGDRYNNLYTEKLLKIDNKKLIFCLFKDRRQAIPKAVDVPTKEQDFIEALNKPDSAEFLNENFIQYLVNKRIEQAFDMIESRSDSVGKVEEFFHELRSKFREIFDDVNLQLNFIRRSYEIEIELSDERKITLNDLPAGLSGLLTILLDLFIRVDLIRKQVNDNTYNPCGIVLIDEPEVHLHLELQEQVLPILTKLFPNIQFIVATHSPAVMASIKNATIFDLTTKETRTSEETVGRSYAELTTAHFGLENDYSSIADAIIQKINKAVKDYENDTEMLKNALEAIAAEQGPYLSPALQMEMELLVIKAQAKLAAVR